jgi:hypothetical protein
MLVSDMPMLRVTLALSLWPAIAAAETPMTAEDFEAYVGTSTITYDYGEGLFGQADYHANRTLSWAFEGEPCMTGKWYPDGDHLCFVFQDDPEASACWNFYKRENSIFGRTVGREDEVEIFGVEKSALPLICDVPEVGV